MTQQDDITQRVRDNETNIALAAKEWATPENVQAFPMTACAHIAGLADALLSKLRAPVADIYVEARECGVCGHVGINDSSDTQAACKNCDWSGDSPKEDHCPGCAQEGTMTAACPKCGSQYSLLADRTISAALASAPVAGEQIIAWDVQDTGLGRRYTTYNPKIAEDLMNLGENVRPLVYASALPPANAAPQASEAVGIEEAFAELDRIVAVRNAALEQAAAICDSVDNHANPMTARDCADAIRALKTQADKDGGQQRAGDGKTREALSWYAEKVAGCRKFGPDGEAARHALDRDGGQLARSALSAPQAEQGERDE